VTVADFTIDRPGLLEINRKIATMGGGDSHRVKKKASLCSASVCFFGGFGRFEIEGLPPQKKNIGGKAWAGPPISDVQSKYTITELELSAKGVPRNAVGGNG
jgi:hypothetical protein